MRRTAAPPPSGFCFRFSTARTANRRCAGPRATNTCGRYRATVTTRTRRGSTRRPRREIATNCWRSPPGATFSKNSLLQGIPQGIPEKKGWKIRRSGNREMRKRRAKPWRTREIPIPSRRRDAASLYRSAPVARNFPGIRKSEFCTQTPRLPAGSRAEDRRRPTGSAISRPHRCSDVRAVPCRCGRRARVSGLRSPAVRCAGYAPYATNGPSPRRRRSRATPRAGPRTKPGQFHPEESIRCARHPYGKDADSVGRGAPPVRI